MEIELNNANTILNSIEKDSFIGINKLVPCSTCNDVKITDENIKSNSAFIVDLWN